MTSAEGRLALYTIGHSTRRAEEFLALLRSREVRQVADVRAMPRSARHPHFTREALAAWLGAAGVGYRHFPELGGLRRPSGDSVNTAWRHPGFRGYADHMQTPAFAEAIDELLRFAAGAPTAVMCAEAVWWRCHRGLLADAVVLRGFDVWHILSAAPPSPHRLHEWARVETGRLTYPGLI